MARRTDFQAAKSYTGQAIKGKCTIAYKIDGVRILERGSKFLTRNNKVSPGFDQAVSEEAKQKIRDTGGDAEIYLGNFHASNGPLQQHEPEVDCVQPTHVYPLSAGNMDQRLFISNFEDPSPALIAGLLEDAVAKGYEGLVIRNAKHWYRVKPSATADVFITGWFEQLDKDKNPKGQLGGFETNWGKVTAFSEEMRKKLWDNPQQYVGRLMTCTYKERYHTGKFRYCVTFNHFRDDKDTESFDTEPPMK